jgi:hypothetical protein
MTAIETTQAGLWLRDFRAIWAGVAPAVCRSLAAGPSQVAGRAKVAVRLGCDMPLDTGLALERGAIAYVFASDDATEGIVAFGGKRTPAFQGR